MNKVESKETLRARMQEELRVLDPEDRRGRSLQICNHVLELPVWKQARVVVVFEPFKYEPEITPLISDLHRRGSEIIAILPTARSQHDVAIFGPIDLVLYPRNRIHPQWRQNGTRVWFFRPLPRASRCVCGQDWHRVSFSDPRIASPRVSRRQT